MDPQGRNLDVSPRWDKSTGLLKQVDPKSSWLDALHPDDLHETVQSVAASRKSGSPIRVEYRIAAGDGEWRWMRSRGAPRFDKAGKIVCWYGSVEDIDQYRRSQHDANLLEVTAAGTSFHEPANVLCLVDPLSAPGRAIIPSRDVAPPDSDLERVRALHTMDLLDTPPEAVFDDLVELASQVCSAPISLISLVDSQRQWFKAVVGIETFETPIGMSFCAHAIQQKDLFIVEDALKDSRFHKNPLVLGDPGIRFYAGIPLYSEDHVAIGTLCVIDTVPRSLSAAQTKALTILAHQVQARFELRTERRKLLKTMAANRELTAALDASTLVLSHAS